MPHNLHERSPGAFWRRVVGMIFMFAAIFSGMNASAQLDVNDAGVANYQIPLQTPPGVGGMTPNISIYYSGNSVNGPLGSGWSIQGLSTITRCPGDRRLDGLAPSVDYSANDKLCLDGQRLIQTDANGTPTSSQVNDSLGGSGMVREYRTEKDLFARIRAYGAAGGNAANGPAYFRVWTKAGQIFEYGVNANTTSNAQITAQGKSVVNVWTVSRISDTVGNYIDFQYSQRDVAFGTASQSGTPGPGREWSVEEIRYTGTATQVPMNRVRFVYNDRADAGGSGPQDRSEAYHLQSKNVSVRLLAQIQTFINWPAAQLDKPASAVAVKTYGLTYDRGPTSGRSRLRKVAECAGAGLTKCLPDTTFDYSPGGGVNYIENEAFRSGPLATTTLMSLSGDLGVVQGDFNGDGKNDILRWSDNPAQNKLFLSGGTDGQFVQAANFNILDQNLFKSDGCYSSLITDINADGLPDILRYSSPQSLSGTNCANYGPIYIYRNNGDGSFTRLNYNGPPLERVASQPIDNGGQAGTHAGWTRGANFYIVDVDADGRLDIVKTELPRNDTNAAAVDPCVSMVCTRVYRSAGDGTFTEIPTNLAHVSVFVQPTAGEGVGASGHLRDVNRDGLIDLVSLPTTYFNKNSSYVSRSNGNFDPSTAPVAPSCDYPFDMNGDGLDDCLMPGTTPGANQLYTQEGNGASVKATNFNLINAGQEMAGSAGVSLADFDGDGRSDILRWRYDAASNAIFLSNGDGTFRQSTFNLTRNCDRLGAGDGSVVFLVGDFTGHGNAEILRLIATPVAGDDGTINQLYIKTDTMPPDQLVAVTSPRRIKTTLTWVPLSNSVSGSLGARYKNDRGTANAAVYPTVDIVWPSYVVATMSMDSGTGTQLINEYSYAGLKSSYEVTNQLGFREIHQQRPAPDGQPMTIHTRNLQSGMFIGMASQLETRLGDINASNAQLLSRTAYVYCDTTSATSPADATSSAPCKSTAKVVRPYVYKTVEEGWDLDGSALPSVTTTNSYNTSGDPTVIKVDTAGMMLDRTVAQASNKTTTNAYYADTTAGDSWILGRLKQSTVASTVPNDFDRTPVGPGAAPLAAATSGTPAILSLSNCSTGASSVSPAPAVIGCTLSNTGGVDTPSISYTSSIFGAGVSVDGPTGYCAAGTTCGQVTVTTGTDAAVYAGTIVATPRGGRAGSAQLGALVKAAGTTPVLAINCQLPVPSIAPTAATQVCTVTNIGGGAAASVAYAASGSVTVTGPTGSCASGATCGTLVATSNGTTATTYSGTVTATPNTGTAASANVTIVVKTASTVPALTLSCPATMTGTAPTAPAVDCLLTNTGTAASSMTYSPSANITYTGPSSCAARSACGTVTITRTSAAGSYTESLTISPAGGSATSAIIKFVIGASTTTVTNAPSALNFGTIGRGTIASKSTTFTNNGTIPATNFSVLLKQTSGSDVGTYSGSGTCGSTLAVGASCTFDVTYKASCTNSTSDPVNGTVTASGSNFPSAVTTLSASTITVGTCS
jgi:hypothetical protein